MKGRWLPTLMVAGSLLAAITTGRLRVASMSSPVTCVACTKRSVCATTCFVALSVYCVARARAPDLWSATPQAILPVRLTRASHAQDGHDHAILERTGRHPRGDPSAARAQSGDPIRRARRERRGDFQDPAAAGEARVHSARPARPAGRETERDAAR